jgi:hypothetical protein
MSDDPALTPVTERELLLRIDGKIDAMRTDFKHIKREAVFSGAVAGAVAGGLSGAVVAVGVAYIKAQMTGGV